MKRVALFAAGVVFIAMPAPSVFAQFFEDVDVIHEWKGEAPEDLFGWINRVIGDLDGDGVNDVGVGVPLNDEGGIDAGKAYIYSGATGALIRTHVGSTRDRLGHDVNGVGDLNGDGITDYVLGAPGAYFLGGPFHGPGEVYLVCGATGNVLHTWVGEANRDAFGHSTSGAGNILVNGVGDIDADGVPDVMVGAPLHDTAGPASGRSYVFSGANFNQTIHVIDGEASVDLFSGGAGGLGDLDGDGYGDFVVGAPQAGANNTGAIYVFSGRTGQTMFPPMQGGPNAGFLGNLFATGPGDVNGDGVFDIYTADLGDSTHGVATGQAYVFSGVDGSVIHTFTGEAAGEGMGVGRGCGDVNGDGYADIISSAFTSSLHVQSGGRAYVFCGRTGGTLRTMSARRQNDQFGYSTVGVGDVNGDGALDFMVSSPYHDDGGSNTGKVYVISGRQVRNIGNQKLK